MTLSPETLDKIQKKADELYTWKRYPLNAAGETKEKVCVDKKCIDAFVAGAKFYAEKLRMELIERRSLPNGSKKSGRERRR